MRRCFKKGRLQKKGFGMGKYRRGIVTLTESIEWVMP